MYTVELYLRVRLACHVDELSQREAASRFGRGGPRESDSCVRWDPTYLRRISEHGEATEFLGGLQGESCA